MKKSLLFFAIVFLLAGCLASVQVSEDGVKKQYLVGESLVGKLNISITDESPNMLVKIGSGQEWTLLNFLANEGMQEGNGYRCSAIGCGRSVEEVRKLNVNEGIGLSNEQTLGFKVYGKSLSVLDADFQLSSDAAGGCSNQILVYLPDSLEFLENTGYSTDSFCGNRNYGCFDNSQAGQTRFELTSGNGLCNKVSFNDLPALLVGARVINISASKPITLSVFDSNYKVRGQCTVPGVSSGDEEVSCLIKSALRAGDYYICASSSAGSYQVRAESSSPVCGTAQLGTEFSFDYEIFAQPYRFTSPVIGLKNATIKQTRDNKEISEFANSYVSKVYNQDCSNGCLIPLKIKNLNNVSQNIQFANTKVKYSTQGNIGEGLDFYLFKEGNSSTVSTDTFQIDLGDYGIKLLQDGNQNIPVVFGNKTYSISVKANKILSFNLLPGSAYVGVPTQFSIVISENLSSVSWDMGDGKGTTSGVKTFSYEYGLPGVYNITINATNMNGINTIRKFNITVGNVNESLNLIKGKVEIKIANLKAFLATMPDWIKPKISETLNITSIESNYNSVLNQIKNSLNDEEKVSHFADLENIAIPNNISIGEYENLPLEIGLGNMRTGLVESISDINESKINRENLSGNIVYWMTDNYAGNITNRAIYVNEGQGDLFLGKIYEINLIKKKNIDSTAYLFIDYPLERIFFDKNYGAKSLNSEGQSATYIDIDGVDSVKFYLTEEINVEDLGMYISPKIEDLGIFLSDSGTKPAFPTWKLIGYSLLAIFGFFGIYIWLQEWYKNRYENYLFKSKDDLYNILGFINNSRIGGLPENEIRRRLAGMRWSGEQVNYAFKKMDGKRTGMWEIPIFRGKEQKVIRAEIAKRAMGGSGARFIKRPFI